MTATFYNIRHRLTQLVVFVACVTFCLLFAQVVEAAGPKPRFDKPKYRVSVHKHSNRVVKVLTWKRKDAPRTNTLTAENRKARKTQPQAETDI